MAWANPDDDFVDPKMFIPIMYVQLHVSIYY